MIIPALHSQPVALDTVQHRSLKLQLPITDWGMAGKLNSLFVAAMEFSDACREFPIVFVRAGKEPDGSDAIAPIAVFGLAPEQNLYLQGGRWRANYMPAVLRMYPFCIARVDDQRFAVCVDMAYPGAGEQGQPLFLEDGAPAELAKQATSQLENLEGEIQRTRVVGKRLMELGLLSDMRFDAKLPDGRTHTVDGFLTVDTEKVNNLPEATVMELHRSGVLGLIHLHWVSMGNMRRLLDWHVERTAAEAPAVAANEATAPAV